MDLKKLIETINLHSLPTIDLNPSYEAIIGKFIKFSDIG